MQRLDQPSGVTFTTVRRPQRAQYRGGSSFLAARQESCPPPAAASCRPQRSQYPLVSASGSGPLIGAQPNVHTAQPETSQKPQNSHHPRLALAASRIIEAIM